jgi:nucleoside-diphosphate-sugar epimerase
MTRFLITGGAGFIGSHLAEHLVNCSESEVVCIDNLSTGNINNLYMIRDKITFLRGDITDISFMQNVMSGIDYVLHQAALPSVPRSVADPAKSNFHNINGTLNVLMAARDAGVKRCVFASSSSVYGTDPTLPKTEEVPTVPRSPYALTKLAGEHYCRIFFELYRLETVCLRYFNVFGPRQNPYSQYAAVIPLFISRILGKKQPVIYGDGEQSRDFTYVSNVVSANINACFAENAAGKVFNIGYGINTSVNQIFSLIRCLLQSEVTPVYADERPGDVRHSIASIDAAREYLGYQPKVSLNDGLEKSVSYYIKHFDETM